MTDVELLPLPSPQVPFIDCDPSMTDIRRLVRWYEQGATEYARANVARAVAPLQAEIDALRTRLEDTVRDSTNKIEALRTEAEQHFQQAMSNGAKARAAQAQANNLRTEIEALRAEVDVLKSENARIREALQAIVDEVSDGLVPYSSDSYLPAHLVEQARAVLPKENSND